MLILRVDILPEQIGRFDGARDEPAEAFQEEGEAFFEERRGCCPLWVAGGAGRTEEQTVDKIQAFELCNLNVIDFLGYAARLF